MAAPCFRQDDKAAGGAEAPPAQNTFKPLQYASSARIIALRSVRLLWIRCCGMELWGSNPAAQSSRAVLSFARSFRAPPAGRFRLRRSGHWPHASLRCLNPARAFPVGLIVAQGALARCARQTSHLRVVRRFALLPAGQTLPSGAIDPSPLRRGELSTLRMVR